MKELVRYWIIRVVVVALILIAGKIWGLPLYNRFFTHKGEVAGIRTAQVVEGRFTVSFHEMGNLEPAKMEQVKSQIDGKIDWVIQDGVTVSKGDLICTVDTTPLKTELNAAQIAYEGAKSNIAKTEEAIKMYKLQKQNDLDKALADYAFSEEQLNLSKDQLEKKRDLAKDKLIAAQDVITAEMDEKSKEKELKKSQMDLDLMKKQIESDVKLKSRDVEEAKVAAATQLNNLETVQQKMALAKMVAPSAGFVALTSEWRGDSTRPVKSGDPTSPGARICTLPDLAHMVVRVQLLEPALPNVHLGMTALIRLDALPDRVLHGTIQTIDSIAQAGGRWGGKKTIDVVIAVKESDPRALRPHMTADVELVGKEMKNAIYVPADSVMEKDGATVVYVKEAGTFRAVTVETGISNDDFICIKKGLKKGQVVALSDPTRPSEGQPMSAIGTSANAPSSTSGGGK